MLLVSGYQTFQEDCMRLGKVFWRALTLGLSAATVTGISIMPASANVSGGPLYLQNGPVDQCVVPVSGTSLLELGHLGSCWGGLLESIGTVTSTWPWNDHRLDSAYRGEAVFKYVQSNSSDCLVIFNQTANIAPCTSSGKEWVADKYSCSSGTFIGHLVNVAATTYSNRQELGTFDDHYGSQLGTNQAGTGWTDWNAATNLC
jgi:hypothetical protein